MGGQYDYFWNKGNPIDKNDIKALRVLQDSLNPFYIMLQIGIKKLFARGKYTMLIYRLAGELS